MAQDHDKKLKGAQSRQESNFRLWMWVLLLAGILLVSVAAGLKHVYSESKKELLILQIGQNMAASGAQPADGSVAQPTNSLADLVKALITESNQQVWLALAADLVRDLGIALVLSVIVTVVIEKYASDRLRELLAHDVLSAAYGKVIPERIYTQVADNVFRSDVCRKKWEVHIKNIAQQVDITTGIAILNIIYSYDLENLNEHKISPELSVGVDLDCPLLDKGIPKFKSIRIYEGNRLLIPETHITALLARQQDYTCKASAEYTESKMTFERTPEEMRFIAQVPIAARDSVTVRYEVERAMRIPGDFILNALVPADGIRITLNVDGFKLGVVPLHPNSDKLKPLPPDTWLFDAGILPWQGFRFQSKF